MYYILNKDHYHKKGWVYFMSNNIKVKYERLLRRKHALERQLEATKEKAERIRIEIKKIKKELRAIA